VEPLERFVQGRTDITQEIRVNHYKTASFVLIYSCLGQSCLVIYIYTELSSGSIQPPILEPVVPTTTFLTETTNYCYKVMSFGLKNVGTT